MQIEEEMGGQFHNGLNRLGICYTSQKAVEEKYCHDGVKDYKTGEMKKICFEVYCTNFLAMKLG